MTPEQKLERERRYNKTKFSKIRAVSVRGTVRAHLNDFLILLLHYESPILTEKERACNRLSMQRHRERKRAKACGEEVAKENAVRPKGKRPSYLR